MLAESANQTPLLTQRSYDAAAINRICNTEEVLPGLSLGLGEVDTTDLIADKRNVAFLGEYGGALFHRTGPGVYSAHDFFLTKGRGKWALAASREMLSRMFREYGARLIFAETPIANRACRMFNRWLGFKSEGVATAIPFPGYPALQMETFVMEAASCR